MKKETKEISKEIEEIAESMVKSVSASKEVLQDTIRNLGPEGLRKALPSLSPEQQALVAEILEDMKKAANWPEDTEDGKKLTPKRTPTPHKKMEAESLTGSDDEDEKLVEDKNKEVKHQGGPKDQPEGWEGQIIKGQGEPTIGHTRDGKPIHEHAGHESHKEFSADNHRDAAEMHQRLSDKHRDDRNNSPFASVAGLQDMGGSKKKFKEAQDQYDKDSLEHDIHRESSAHHRRMADAKEGRQMEDLTPEDHREQAARHLGRVDKLMALRKMYKGYGSTMAKDMGFTGGAGGYGMAMSMNKSGAELKFEKSYQNFLTKKQGVPEGVDPEKWERGVKEVKNKPGVDNPYAIVNAAMTKKSEKNAMCPPGHGENLEKKKMKKAKKMAKALKKIVEMAKALGMSKEDIKKAIENAGGDLKVVKGEMKSKINKEEDQVEIKTQDESPVTDPKPDRSKGDLEIKAETTADEAEKKIPEIKKSIRYPFKSSIAANTLGRNTHWDVDAYIEKSEAERQEAIKKGGYLNEKEVSEELKKAQDPNRKLDINEMIAKGFDRYSTSEIARLEGLRNHKPDQGALRKSNYDEEIARSMGMSKEEYEKIFGSNE